AIGSDSIGGAFDICLFFPHVVFHCGYRQETLCTEHAAKLKLCCKLCKLFIGVLRLILWYISDKIFVCGAVEDMIRAVHIILALKSALSGERSIVEAGGWTEFCHAR
ncbi:MAG: hypothetical protein DU429_09115, partial [Candidatus Tokpelaia sp.]